MSQDIVGELENLRYDLAPKEGNYLDIGPIDIGSLYSEVCLVSEPGSGYHYHITDLLVANAYSDIMRVQLYQFTAVSAASSVANLKLNLCVAPFDTKHVQFAGDGLKLKTNRGLSAGVTVAAGAKIMVRGYKEAD
jgi:hypothetical protein